MAGKQGKPKQTIPTRRTLDIKFRGDVNATKHTHTHTHTPERERQELSFHSL